MFALNIVGLSAIPRVVHTWYACTIACSAPKDLALFGASTPRPLAFLDRVLGMAPVVNPRETLQNFRALLLTTYDQKVPGNAIEARCSGDTFGCLVGPAV